MKSKSKSPRSRSVRRSVKRRSSKPRRRSRSLVRIPVKKGLLEGYHLSELARDRRTLLMRMIRSKEASYSDIIKRLNVLVIYNKNRHPEISDKVYRDLAYMQKHVPDKYKLSPVARSRTTSPFVFKKSSKKRSGMKKKRSLKKRSQIKKGGMKSKRKIKSIKKRSKSKSKSYKKRYSKMEW